MASESLPAMFQFIDGERYIFFRDPDKVREALQFQPRAGDIVEVVYPKCGMQMMQQMIQLIVHDGHCAKDLREFGSRAPFLEDCGGNWPGEKSCTRLFRTHIRMGRIAVSTDAKYVYVARNPWDACYSQYVMNQKMPLRPMRETFDEFLDMFLEGSLTNGCYFQHVLSGYTRRREPNVFFTTYESMMRDTAATLLDLADFLGEMYAERLRKDNGLLATIVRHSTPAFLRSILEIETREMVSMMFRSPALASSGLTERDVGDGTFSLVCRPEVGAWKEVFTQKQLRRTVSKIEESVGKHFVPDLWNKEWHEVLQAAL
ncbi:sulfotransferase ssu-1-like [Dermacentor andersoni]|uniref:sulfotransferase ssu-1-like n=1 Tax=Dermacentor andersoni TaxID=34620 RepID=UPI00215519E0|nr:sulfotransferase ssu-1-like [Dermacentor andersoni]